MISLSSFSPARPKGRSGFFGRSGGSGRFEQIRAVVDPPFAAFLIAVALWLGAFTFSVAPATAQDGPELKAPTLPASEDTPTSPVRRIERDRDPAAQISQRSQATEAAKSNDAGEGNGAGAGNDEPGPNEFRSIDGSGNNLERPSMGAAHTQLFRAVTNDYADGVSALAGQNRIGARQVSNRVHAQGRDRTNPQGVTDYLWQWGQFLDHDIDLTDGADPAEPADIAIPAGDPWFDPTGSGTAVLSFNRSLYDPDTGISSPRQQVNEITAWIDASNVYGSDDERAAALRTLDGTGRLKTSEGNLLPFNVDGLPNAGGPSPSLFLAGDVRANEQVGLAAMHTLWVREHNRQAARIAENDPNLNGDQIYQRARRMVGALMQVITYREFLPMLLGPDALSPYRGYRPEVDASIANLFSTAAYRFGHSTLSTTILRLNRNLEPIGAGNLALRDAFFAPLRLVEEGGIDPILRGLASQACQSVDPYVIDDLRNFLFGPPGAGGFDLVSLNIQRGRDHGLPSYNDVRQAFGMPRAQRFADITRDRQMQDRLRSAYSHVDEVDLWVGGLAEDRRRGAMVGELWYRIFKDQFEALRDGDRFWYQRALNRRDLDRAERTSLADVIRRNTDIGNELQDEVFYMPRSQ